MRKNKSNREKIKTNLLSTFRVSGYNLDRFIEKLKREKVEIVNLKKTNLKEIIFSAKSIEDKKVFAIGKNLCYNIKKIKIGGKLYPLVWIYKNVGIAIGVLIFFIISFLAGNTIFNVKYCGTGVQHKFAVEKYLSSIGVQKYALFYKIDLSSLGKDIMSNNKEIAFAQCYRRGGELVVELVAIKDSSEVITGSAEIMASDVSGKLLELKVYRGKALFSVGDFVKSGDVIVDGEVEGINGAVKIGVIASAKVLVDFEYTYISDNDKEEDYALIFAQEKLYDKQIISNRVEKTRKNNKYVYKVNIEYMHTIYVM